MMSPEVLNLGLSELALVMLEIKFVTVGASPVLGVSPDHAPPLSERR